MNDEITDNEIIEENINGEHSDYTPVNRFDASAVHHLSGMYQSWFLDYASYVILERAVPHIEDGLKPVQRRILHSMKRMDDGRYNKVANIVGHTMQFHPHGDASIGDALVQIGQKDLLVDTQGNWGNILTGDRAAAPRYIEARLSKFALDTVFNPKTTEWQLSYDGRNKEPITLPVKYPLLLAQGAEGIAVGLSSKILPHNFCDICDAAVSYLHGQDFRLYPDFPTGGSIDISKYNDGQRGGSLKVRAKIEKRDSKTLVIREIPYGKTTATLIDSILRAIEKGKIKARKVEDNTAAQVEIIVHLAPGVSSDKTLDALYAFSDCEVNISPNCCVIEDDKPKFLNVSDVLRASVDRTKDLIRRELEIRKGELLEQYHFSSLEKIFIEERIYKDRKFEQAPDVDTVCEHIDERLTPYYPQLVREVTKDDILKLLEIKMQRILKFNKEKAEELMARIKAEIDNIDRDLANMVEVTANWFTFLKDKYGKDHPRLTEKELRHHRGIEGGRSQRETVYQPAGRIYRYKPEKRRVRVQLLRHRRHHHLLQRRKIQGGARGRQDIRGQKHTASRRFQKERQANYIQRGIPRRPKRPLLHQALQCDGNIARPRERPHLRHTGLESDVLHGQSQRRGRDYQSDARPDGGAVETQDKHIPRKGLLGSDNQRPHVKRQHSDKKTGKQNWTEEPRALNARRAQGLVRRRREATEL